MKKTLFIIVFIIFISRAFAGYKQSLPGDSSIHQFVTDSVEGVQKINFSHFNGRKILIVTVDLRNPDMVQLSTLQKLQNTLQSKLAVVLLPLTEMANDPLINSKTAKFLRDFKITMVTCGKQQVSQHGISPLLQWIAKKSLEIKPGFKIKDGYQKFLIDKDGILTQVFEREMIPSEAMVN